MGDSIDESLGEKKSKTDLPNSSLNNAKEEVSGRKLIANEWFNGFLANVGPISCQDIYNFAIMMNFINF